jgi:hypothetical protein
MAACHLSCPACRIRVRANAPEIAVLEGRCPLCEARLTAVSSGTAVMGFRSFNLDELSEQDADDHADPSGYPTDLVALREALGAQDPLAAQRWEDDGGSIANAAAAKS